jgi:hypothetical protein
MKLQQRAICRISLSVLSLSLSLCFPGWLGVLTQQACDTSVAETELPCVVSLSAKLPFFLNFFLGVGSKFRFSLRWQAAAHL